MGFSVIDSSGRLKVTSTATAPGGSDTQVQFNDSSAFGGDAGLTYNKTTDQLTLAGLFDISGASAGQIKFPASQNASSDANTLDDYEEGTWTPVIGDGTETGQTYAAQKGQYLKIGQLVAVFFDVTLTAKGTFTTVFIQGLPFTSNNNANVPRFVGSAIEWDSTTNNFVNIIGRTPVNTTHIALLGIGAAGTSIAVSLLLADISNSTTFRGLGLYRATA